MFGNKPEFSRADVLAFGKEIIEEAARDILAITPDISMTDLGKKLGVTESRARSIVRKMTEREEA